MNANAIHVSHTSYGGEILWIVNLFQLISRNCDIAKIWKYLQSVRLWFVKCEVKDCEMPSRRALGNPFQLSRNVSNSLAIHRTPLLAQKLSGAHCKFAHCAVLHNSHCTLNTCAHLCKKLKMNKRRLPCNSPHCKEATYLGRKFYYYVYVCNTHTYTFVHNAQIHMQHVYQYVFTAMHDIFAQ